MIERSHECEKKSIINPETLKVVMQEMLLEAGVQIQLYTFASDAIVENNQLKGIIIESKSGREAIMGKVVIDCTGDGDIAAKAGANFIKGRESDGLMQPMTLMFKVGGVDYSRAVFPYGFEDHIALPKGDIQALGKQNIPHPAGHVLLYHTSVDGVVTCNMTNCTGVDGTRAEDLTKAEFQCRSQIPYIIRFLREFVPGYENAYLMSSASIVGVRETRHFEGEYTFNEYDILEGTEFEDWAVKGAWFGFDVHNLTGAGLDKTGVQKEFKQKASYMMPYRCLVPKKIDNLLLAGRNISGTHLAHSSYRVMPICVGMGHAAGVAAALCAKSEVTPRALDVKKMQEILAKEGVD